MKHINQFITEYIIKKKLDKPIDSEDHYKYFPKSKEELIYNINKLIKQNDYNFNCINTSKITDMSNLFKNLDGIEDKNFDVSRWDVSSVEDMSYMFMYCKNFNGNLFGWDVSNVTNMTGMFGGCESFEGNGIENWNITNVESIEEMFAICLKLNIDFSNWNVRNIRNFENIFYNCESLEGKGFDKWNVSKAVNTKGMFQGCKNLDFDLSKWNISKLKSIKSMFSGCEKFTGKGLEKWDISNSTDINGMFNGCILLKNKPSWYRYKN